MKTFDFTGSIPGAYQFPHFCSELVAQLRKSVSNLIVVDYGFGFDQDAPHLVSDHLNLSGSNPLVGPNDSCGPRFPVVNDIYIAEPPNDLLCSLPKGVLGGLKEGVELSGAESLRLRELGADFFSYNLANTMIIAAHAGLRVIGIVIPQGAPLDEHLLDAVKELSDRELPR